MKENILLTIAVTTYNRRKFLETTVDRSIKQIIDAGLEKEVEILISNDSSTDNTSEFVNKINEKYTFVRGFNQNKNLGVTKNLEWVVNESKGIYVQLHGDDDLMEEGAIAYFIKIIKEKAPNFILINTTNIHSLDDSNQKYKFVLENRLKINENIFIDNIETNYNKLKKTNNWLYLTNFITAVIFKKDLWQREMKNALKYVRPENVFLWQAPLIIGIKKYGRLHLISQCFILCRKNPTDNYALDPRGLYYINLYESIEISRLIKYYLPSEYKSHKRIYGAFIINSFIKEIGRGRKIRKHAWNAFMRYYDIFPQNIKFIIIAITPKLFMRFYNSLLKLK